MGRKQKKTMAILLILSLLLMFVPFLVQKGAEFGGSDDAGSLMIEEINRGYQPWFTPVLETWIGGEIPGEVESLLFCLQTGIGVGVFAFFMGRMVERKQWEKRYPLLESTEKKQRF